MRYRISDILKIGGIIFLLALAVITYFFFSQSQKRQTTDSQAATEVQLKVMTYNIADSFKDAYRGEDWVRNELVTLAQYIKDNQLEVVALQEVGKVSDEDDGNFEMDDLAVINAELNRIGYPMHTTIMSNKIDFQQGSSRTQSFEAFLHKQDDISTMYKETPKKNYPGDQGGSVEFRGFSSIVVDTSLGRIRFINQHPFPQISQLVAADLVIFVNSLKSENIPIIIMGDFNLRFDEEATSTVVQNIYNAGFYRACDPAKFPNASCNDSVVSDNDNHGIDQVLVDKRATFFTKNAFIDRNRTYSDHFPSLAHFTNQAPTVPRCDGMNIYAGTTNISTNQQGSINISTAGTQAFSVRVAADHPSDMVGKKIDVCWSIAGQTASFYQQPGMYACDSNLIVSRGSRATVGVVQTAPRTFQQYIDAIKNNISLSATIRNIPQAEFNTKGLVFVTSMYNVSSASTVGGKYCTTNVGWNSGRGAKVTLPDHNTKVNDPNNCGIAPVYGTTQRTCYATVKVNAPTATPTRPPSATPRPPTATPTRPPSLTPTRIPPTATRTPTRIPTAVTCVPSLVNPANGSSVMSSPTFSWLACPGTNNKYKVIVKKGTATFATGLVLNATTFNFSGSPWSVGAYSWTVTHCTNSDCVGGTVSATRTFNYVMATPTCSVLPAPTNLSPPSNTNLVSGLRTITWSPVTGSNGYALRINDLSNGWDAGCNVLTGDVCVNTTSNSYTYNFIAGRSYSIWIHSRNNCGQASSTTLTGIYTVANPTTIPTRTPTPNIPTINPGTITPTPTTIYNCPLRSKGDANCNGGIDILDYACIKEELTSNRRLNGCGSSDFNGVGGVDILDFTIWKSNILSQLSLP